MNGDLDNYFVCQCDDPLIKCDLNGCRCTLCGKLERTTSKEYKSLTARLKTIEKQDPFKKLPALAKRLGVEPLTEPYSGVIIVSQNERYDVFDLINAVLDKIEEMK